MAGILLWLLLTGRAVAGVAGEHPPTALPVVQPATPVQPHPKPAPQPADEDEEELPVEKKASTEFVLELDAYYSDIGLYIPLTKDPIPNFVEAEETKVYKHLLLNSLTPRFMVLEAAVFPMPVLGVYLKKNHPQFYDSTGIGADLNVIESITAGFQEPYAFSVFFGNVVNFVKPDEKRKGTNKGYMGYLLSYATEHIKNNRLISDNSFEVEWKMKGDRIFKDDKLSWSFRIGSKVHDHPNITNVAYLGLRRSNLDFNSPALSWFKNSSFDIRFDFSLKNSQLIRQEYVVGKKYPFKKQHVALRFDVGMIWESNDKYTGPLRDNDFHNFILVFRPNLQF